MVLLGSTASLLIFHLPDPCTCDRGGWRLSAASLCSSIRLLPPRAGGSAVRAQTLKDCYLLGELALWSLRDALPYLLCLKLLERLLLSFFLSAKDFIVK